MKVTHAVHITFSKIFALLILLAGTIYSFFYKDSAVMITTLTISGGLTGVKTIKGGPKHGEDKESV